MPEILTLRVVAKGTGIVGNGISIFLLIDTAKTAKLIDTDHVGIAFYRLCTVTLGSTVVVEIIFGNTPEIPGFIEIGFSRDGLVEILDGQHIVLIIERRAPYHHQTVDIVLGK
jgi:hypothetical protein